MIIDFFEFLCGLCWLVNVQLKQKYRPALLRVGAGFTPARYPTDFGRQCLPNAEYLYFSESDHAALVHGPYAHVRECRVRLCAHGRGPSSPCRENVRACARGHGNGYVRERARYRYANVHGSAHEHADVHVNVCARAFLP